MIPIEIKASMTLSLNFLKGVTNWQELSGEKQGMLIYGGDEDVRMRNVDIKSWKRFNIF